MCMWPFTNPGVTTRWRASITRSARAPASVVALPTRLTRPPSMRIEPSRMILRSRSTVRTYRALSILRLWVVMGGEVGTGGEEDLLRVGRPDELHQLFHALVVITETQPCRGDAEARVVGGDAHIAADGDADTAADAEAVDHRQERLRQRAERVLAARRDAAVLLLIGHVAPSLLELGDVGAGHERLVAGPAQDDDPDGVVGGQILHVLGHELPHLQAHGVALLRLVEDDPADRPVLLQQKLRRFAHGALLSRNDVRATCIASALVTQAPPCGGGQWVAAGAGRRSAATHCSAFRGC